MAQQAAPGRLRCRERNGRNPAADKGALREDLEAAVETLLKAFAGPLGEALPGLVADMARDEELAEAIRHQVLATRRNSMQEAFARANARGETRADLDIELLLDMLTGPFYYRILFRHAPISRRTTRTAVEYVLRVAGVQTAALTSNSRAAQLGARL